MFTFTPNGMALSVRTIHFPRFKVLEMHSRLKGRVQTFLQHIRKPPRQIIKSRLRNKGSNLPTTRISRVSILARLVEEDDSSQLRPFFIHMSTHNSESNHSQETMEYV
jgi:hypothetical protein